MINVVCTAGIGSTMGAIFLVVLILIFFLKMYNILHKGEIYDYVYSILGFIGSVFCVLFVLLGLLVDQTVIMSAYLNIAGFILVVITMLFIFELLFSFSKIGFRDRLETDYSRK